MSTRARRTSWLAHALAIAGLALGLSLLVLQFTTFTAAPTLVDILGALAIPLFELLTLFVGWFIAWKRPGTALGWLLLTIPASLGIVAVLADFVGNLLASTAPAIAEWAYWLGDGGWSWIPPIGLLFTQVPLRFPNGRLPSRRWNWFSWYTVAALVVAAGLVSTGQAHTVKGVPNPTYVAWGDAMPVMIIVAFAVCLVPAFVGSIASLFVRYRGADTVERAQLRWVFWALAVAVGLLVASWLVSIVVDNGARSLIGTLAAWFQNLTAFGYSLIPIAIFFAVLRYGLYGIDRIISRTVSYAIVTIVIVGLYVGVVIAVSSLLPSLSSLGVALATLAAAAAFLPLLRWVQRVVDRRFNRAAYDAQRVVEAFGQRLRNGADPHTAPAELIEAAERTLQPTSVGLWTRPASR